MKIAILSPIYPTRTVRNCSTPVVHYFAKEWQAMGHQVEVFNVKSRYPDILYWFCRKFEKTLNSKLGSLVPTAQPEEFDECIEGIRIHHFNYIKTIPHSRVRKSRLNKVIARIQSLIGDNVPDVFIAHWDNPQLDLLYRLKQIYNNPTFLTLHGGEQYLMKNYGNQFKPMMQSLNGVGFRSVTAKKTFEKMFWPVDNSFFAFSGVSETIVNIPLKERTWDKVSSIVFVGSLIKRKYPEEIIPAAISSLGKENFTVTYIGEGKEKESIQANYGDMLSCQITFTGKIERNKIVDYLDSSDIFVMISRAEVFGLVYLEAMARGCITIAARNEGIDGVIIYGENGFLCEAGNVDELASIFDKIKAMSPEERRKISENGINTARDFTDKKVAEKYINDVIRLM